MKRARQLAETRKRMQRVFSPTQVLGRTQTIGCVAVEITQRCNLDCTLCYLSEHSQRVRDLPLPEIFKRLDAVLDHYGPGAHVQITGGEPTLRNKLELIDIVRYARGIGLYPALFTNGIAASRSLLSELAQAGLCDVAFHVDTTQRRPGYESEVALNVLRGEYLARARDLGLMVIFNTTIHQGNFAEVPELVHFFTDNADVIGLVSLNLQADTGRGEWRTRDGMISRDSVRSQLEAAVGNTLPWDVVQIGHPDCHSYMPTLVMNGSVYPVIDDAALFSRFLVDFEHVRSDRHDGVSRLVFRYLRAFLYRPQWWPMLVRYGGRRLKEMFGDLLGSAGRVHKLSFFVQNFMDAEHLDQERVHACSFMVMTAEGPVSMCQHNARRDDFILKPMAVTYPDGKVEEFQPLVWRDAQRKTAGLST